MKAQAATDDGTIEMSDAHPRLILTLRRHSRNGARPHGHDAAISEEGDLETPFAGGGANAVVGALPMAPSDGMNRR